VSGQCIHKHSAGACPLAVSPNSAPNVQSRTEILLGGDKEVWDVVFLAQNGDVRNDLNGGDVSREDRNTLLLPADRFQHFLHTATDAPRLGGFSSQFQTTRCELEVRKWLGDRRQAYNV